MDGDVTKVVRQGYDIRGGVQEQRFLYFGVLVGPHDILES